MRKKCGLLKLVMKAKQQAFHWFISMYSVLVTEFLLLVVPEFLLSSREDDPRS